MYQVLIGSYTSEGNSEGIYRMQFDAETGLIEPQPLQVVRTHNPSWLTLDLNRNRVYAVNENGPGHPDPVGRVSAFILAPTSGKLSVLEQQITLGDEPTHLSQSRDGRYLFVSNYGSRANPGGSLAVVPLAKDGTLLPVTQIATHKASEVHPERQQSAHVHSAVMSPNGKTLFVSDLGADKIFVYRYDPTNAERPLSQADPAFISLPDGSGPRHLVFSPDGSQAYATLELSAQVARFDHVDGSWCSVSWWIWRPAATSASIRPAPSTHRRTVAFSTSVTAPRRTASWSMPSRRTTPCAKFSSATVAVASRGSSPSTRAASS